MTKTNKHQPDSSLEIKKGSADLWREVLTQIIPQLYSMFINKGIHPELAEELVQNTVFDAIRGRASYDSTRGTPQQWIFSIGKNNLALEIRRRQNQPKANGQLLKYMEAIETNVLPDEILERKETAELVLKALDDLDEKEKNILQAKYIDNLSARQISKQMEITEKAVHSLLYRARNSLREKLVELAPFYTEAQKS